MTTINPTHISYSVYLVMAAVTLLAGFVDSIAGGGGLLAVPSLLAVGIPPHFVLGTNKLAATIGLLGSNYPYIKKQVFRPKLWVHVIVVVLFGAILGVIIAHLFNPEHLQILLPVLLLFVVIYQLWPKKIKVAADRSMAEFNPPRSSGICLGALLGFYDGFLGPGTGSFWATLTMLFYKLDIVTASGVARFMNLIANAVALITFFIFQSVYIKLGLVMGCTYFLGSYIGASSSIRFGTKFIKPIFLTIVILMLFYLVIKTI